MWRGPFCANGSSLSSFLPPFQIPFPPSLSNLSLFPLRSSSLPSGLWHDPKQDPPQERSLISPPLPPLIGFSSSSRHSRCAERGLSLSPRCKLMTWNLRRLSLLPPFFLLSWVLFLSVTPLKAAGFPNPLLNRNLLPTLFLPAGLKSPFFFSLLRDSLLSAAYLLPLLFPPFPVFHVSILCNRP